MKSIFLVLGCFLFSNFAQASENPYIELSKPSDLMEVHVNTSKYNPKNGIITKTEISFGDGTVVTNKSDAYHKYASTGNYTINVKVWTLIGGVSSFSKSVDLNTQYRLESISNSVVYSKELATNRHYNFQITNDQASKLYKIRLVKRPNTPETTSIIAALLGSCDLNLGIKVNSIPLFQNNEINCNTSSIEKIVSLKSSNELVYDEPLLQQNRKLFATEISEIRIVKDEAAPIISSNIPSGGITKNSNVLISINDESDIVTRIWDNQQQLLFSTELKSFTIPLNEGTNNFVIRSEDQYGNTSANFQLTDITRDSYPADINVTLNSEYIYATYPQNFTLTIFSNELLQSLLVNGVEAQLVAPNTYSYILKVNQQGQIDINIRAYDLAGNESIKLYQPIFNIDNIAPTISTNLANHVITNENSFHIKIVDNADTVTEVYKDGNLIKTTTEKDFDLVIEEQGLNSFVIKSRDIYNNEAQDLYFEVTYDSNAALVLTLDKTVRNKLTNKTQVKIFGTTNVKIVTASLNGNNIAVGSDGLSFNGFFSPPADGRYRVEVTGADQLGNIATAVGFVRVLADLPEVYEDYAPLTATPTETGHRIDYGPGFNGPNSSNYCDDLKRIFTEKEEFGAKLQQIQKQEDAFLDRFPEGYAPDIPTTDSLMEFIGQIDEPLNYVKAGYLAVCENKIPMPETNCPENRNIYKLLTGQYPEPMIIKLIPGLPPFIQDFLISRYNICTGLDTSGLTCEDMKTILPLIADLTFPSVGQMMGSPVGQVVMDALMCKEMCEIPGYKDSPYCKDFPIPEIPQYDIPTITSFAPPGVEGGNVDTGSPNGPGGGGPGGHGGSGGSGSSGGGHGGGGGGGSCGGWFSSCDDGSGVFICSVFPEIFFCKSGVQEISERAVYDPNVMCPSENWTLADAINASSPTNYLMSVIGKCKKTSVPGVPQLKAPVITVISPIENQQVSSTVRVKGFVSDANAFVRINGIDVKTFSGAEGANFDVVVPTPGNKIVKVEAVNEWGIQAIPVSVSVLKPAHITSVSMKHRHICIIDDGSAWCKSTDNVGFDFVGFRPMLGMETGVSQIDTWLETAFFLKDGDVYVVGRYYGRLSDGSYSETTYSNPVKIFGPNVTDISVGNEICAIKENGLYCWYNGYSSVPPTPALVPGMSEGVTDVNSWSNVCAVKYGKLYCGVNYPTNFVEIVGIENPSEVLSAGNCAIQNQDVLCWGAYMYESSGEYKTVAKKVPGLEGLPKKFLSNFGQQICVHVNEESLRCWNAVNDGHEGFGNVERYYHSEPEMVAFATNRLSTGTEYCMALKDGNLYCPLSFDGPFDYPVRGDRHDF